MITKKHIGFTVGTALGIASLVIIPASAMVTARTTNNASTSVTANDQAKVKLIINRGNSEIQRRLTTLRTFSTKLSTATKLTASDKTSLSGEVTDAINGLTSLQSELDADTIVADARTDAKSIITDYRVYALVVPKVNLIKTADDQQVAESKLSALVPKLQSRLSAAQTAGKNVTALNSGLQDMTSQISAAQAISSSVESSVIGLQPSDYNNDHTVLSGYRDKLKTAQNEIRAAVSDATSIVTGLKNL